MERNKGLVLTDVLDDSDALAAEISELHGAVVLADGLLPSGERAVPARHLDDVARLDAGRSNAHTDAACIQGAQKFVSWYMLEVQGDMVVGYMGWVDSDLRC